MIAQQNVCMTKHTKVGGVGESALHDGVFYVGQVTIHAFDWSYWSSGQSIGRASVLCPWTQTV